MAILLWDDVDRLSVLERIDDCLRRRRRVAPIGQDAALFRCSESRFGLLARQLFGSEA
jgi:chromosome condensin MukBEF MukE localization factor